MSVNQKSISRETSLPKTDGQCLILPRVVIGGKKYDFRLWKFDPEGKEVSFNEQTPLTLKTIEGLQRYVTNIFSSAPDPSRICIIYANFPERCVLRDLRNWRRPGLALRGPRYQPTIETARKLYRLLNPERRTEWTRDPKANRVIYPTRMPPPKPKLDRKSSSQTGAESTAKPADSSAAPKETKQQLVDELNRAGNDFKSDKPFLKDVTYAGLSKYSLQENKSSTDPLYRAYEAFKQILKDPLMQRMSKEDLANARQMRDWIAELYILLYKSFMQNQKERGSPDEEKYFAASIVVGFITVRGQSIDDLVRYLMNIKI